jgi:adiponectin receptor
MDSNNPPYNLRSRKSKQDGDKVQVKLVLRSNKVGREELPWWSKDRLKMYKFDQVPEYMQDNEFILGSYRSGYTYYESFISLFHLHNESVNVWSHLFGFVFFCCIIGYTWQAMGHMHIEDKILVTVFLGLACYTMLFSSLFHLNLCVSAEAEQFWGCLDHSGISASIAGGSIAVMYILLHCDGRARLAWIGLLVLCNCVGIVGPMFK